MGNKADEVKETAQQRAMSEMAMSQLEDYRKRWLPVQQNLAASVKRRGAAGSSAREQASGKVSTENAVRFGEAGQGLEAALTESGAGPGSSRFKLASSGLADDQATSRGLGFTASDQAIDDAYTAGLSAITAIGRGEKSQAMQGMQNVATMSGQQAAADASLAAQERAGNAMAVGQAAGFGLSMAGRKPAQPNAPAATGFGSVPGGFMTPDGGTVNNPSAYTAGP